jgi:16S rRNA (guanine527-N7)-methyltransferase
MNRRGSDHPQAGNFDPAAYPADPIPEDDWRWLCARCAELGIPDPSAQRAVFDALHAHLVGVNAWMNLTRITSARDYCERHLLDSLSCLLAPVFAGLEPGVACLDLGSGGGYPGLPLMTLLPELPWVLVDSRRRKVDFLSQALRLTPCRLAEARHFRAAESAAVAPDLHGSCQLVVARAVGQAELLIREAAGLLESGGCLLLLKGPSYLGEEHERALAAAAAMRLRYEQTTEIALVAGEAPRLLLVYRKQ